MTEEEFLSGMNLGERMVFQIVVEKSASMAYNPVFDTLKKIKLLQRMIYKHCSSFSPSFNI